MAATRTAPSAPRSTSPPSPTGKTKRARTKHACDECRRSQKKCDGDKPVCLRCRTNGTNCTYTPHKSRGQCDCGGHKAAETRGGPVADVFIFPDSTPVPSTNWSRRSSSSLASPSPPDLESYSQTHSPLYTASDDSPHSSQPGDSFDAGYPSPAPSSHLNLFGPVSAHQEHALPPPVADAYPYPNMFATHQHHPIQEMYYNAEADTASRNPTIGYPSPYQSLPSISESSLPLYDDSSSMPSYPIQHSRDHSHLQVSSSLIPRSPADNSNIYVPRTYDSPPQQSYSDSASNPSPPTSFSSPQQHYVDSVRNPSPPLPFPRSQHPDSAPYTMAPAAYPQPQQWPAPPPPIPSHSPDYLPHLHNVNPCAGPQSPHNTPSTQYAYDVYPWPQ